MGNQPLEITIYEDHHDKQPQTRLFAAMGDNLYAVLRDGGVSLDTPCAGRCFCGKCHVHVKGCANPVKPLEAQLLSSDAVRSGMRLACAVEIQGSLTVTLHEPQARIQTSGRTEGWTLNPSIRHGQIPGLLDGPLYGIAVDIGTTTLAAYLFDLTSGEQLAQAGCPNSQRAFGADVLSRIASAMDQPGAARLSALIIKDLHTLTQALCQRAGIPRDRIVHAVAAGNTVMLHLLLGLPCRSLAVFPFTPETLAARQMAASELGWALHPQARLDLLPCIAGYVGADTVAAILAAGLDETDQCSLLIDIGTNGEIVLGSRKGLVACAAAAGPAFEGAHIRQGMGSVNGAISQIAFSDGRIRYHTLSDAPPVGICGSGLVDAAAMLLACGVMQPTGKLVNRVEIPLAQNEQGEPAVCLTDAQHPVWLSQKDIRQVQLAKGAIAAGVELSLRHAGIHAGQIGQVLLAGGFGSAVNPASACAIGLIPESLAGRVFAIGNAAGMGACHALLNRQALSRAEKIARQVEYIDLSRRADFNDVFAQAMLF